MSVERAAAHARRACVRGAAGAQAVGRAAWMGGRKVTEGWVLLGAPERRVVPDRYIVVFVCPLGGLHGNACTRFQPFSIAVALRLLFLLH